MVVFTCNNCGDSLQKPKVEKHHSICRKAKSLTCVDCLKDFSEDYASHTKCITEEERYAAKNGNSKPIVKKGEVKQESWTKLLTDVVNSAGNVPSGLKRILDIVAGSVNVPRKQHKFTNFVKSSSGSKVKDEDIKTVWNMIEQFKSEALEKDADQTDQQKKHKIEDATVDAAPAKKRKSKDLLNVEETSEMVPKKQRKSKGVEQNESELEPEKQRKSKGTDIQQNEGEDILPNLQETTEKKSKKKRKSHGSVETPVETSNSTEEPKPKKHKTKNSEANGTETKCDVAENGTVHNKSKDNQDSEQTPNFLWEQEILNVLASKDGISVSKLQKKMLKAYSKCMGREPTTKTIKKFKQKLKKTTAIEVKEDCVRLISKA